MWLSMLLASKKERDQFLQNKWLLSVISEENRQIQTHYEVIFIKSTVIFYKNWKRRKLNYPIIFYFQSMTALNDIALEHNVI